MARVWQTLNRKSQFTGKMNSMRLKIDPKDMIAWRNGKLIQDAFPYLSIEEREFLKTGSTPQEWEELFGPAPGSQEEE